MLKLRRREACMITGRQAGVRLFLDYRHLWKLSDDIEGFVRAVAIHDDNLACDAPLALEGLEQARQPARAVKVADDDGNRHALELRIKAHRSSLQP